MKIENIQDLYINVSDWSPNFHFIKGWVTVKAGICLFRSGLYDYIQIMGWCSDDLIKDSLENNEDEIRINKEGIYRFTSLLRYNSAQVGNYPPPNIEVPEHCEIEFLSINKRIR